MRIKFNGNDPALNIDLGREVGEGDLLEPGKSYDVSDKLGKRLVASSSQFEQVDEKVKK